MPATGKEIEKFATIERQSCECIKCEQIVSHDLYNEKTGLCYECFEKHEQAKKRQQQKQGEAKMEKRLVATEETAPIITIMQSPEKAVDMLDRIKNNFTELLKKNKEIIKIQGNDYVKYEGWATVGIAMGIVPRIVKTEDLMDDGKFIGCKSYAEAVLIKNGQAIGAGIGYCMTEEQNWKGKPRFAIASMSETRAAGKALKLMLSGVIAHMGFEPTPAEEMISEDKPLDINDKLGFGKHADKTWKEVAAEDREYLCWLTAQDPGKSSPKKDAADKALDATPIDAQEPTEPPVTGPTEDFPPEEKGKAQKVQIDVLVKLYKEAGWDSDMVKDRLGEKYKIESKATATEMIEMLSVDQCQLEIDMLEE